VGGGQTPVLHRQFLLHGSALAALNLAGIPPFIHHGETAMSIKIVKPLTLAVGVAMVGSLSLAQIAKADTGFVAKQLSSGYLLAAGEPAKAGEKKAEGKCGEGKCSVAKMDTDKDGKASKAEFMAAHEKMFNDADTNKDGMLSDDEIKAAHKGMEGSCSGDKAKGKEGSCSGAKKAKEGSCSGEKKAKEGSCSGEKKGKEGSCGGH
jgi:uncharacterized low-complexity protein